ncbi:MAG: helix-turn-helix domain-containing protein [Candidatus Thorarchaeota archaeon]|nr:MAG: helix-turn-helix domain-containing protein [Candidatus Thorarchaeota archaeon]
MDQSRALQRLAETMAGEICIAEDDPGAIMKRWRERFKISQKDLARHLGVSPSVISDYESGRRKSPRVETIRRFIEGLIEIDSASGGRIAMALEKLESPEIASDAILDIREFRTAISAQRLVESLQCRILTHRNLLSREIYGYTVLDSVKAIVTLTPQQLLRLYGGTTQRAAVLTNVSTGRSPMVAIKASQIGTSVAVKPAVAILQGVKELDPLAVRIADNIHLPLCVSELESEEELVRVIRTINP